MTSIPPALNRERPSLSGTGASIAIAARSARPASSIGRAGQRAEGVLGTQVRPELLQNSPFGLKPHQALLRFPILEEDQRGQSEYSKAGGGVQIGVGVDLAKAHLTLQLFGELLHHRIQLPARMAPIGSEVHHDRDLGGQHFGVESLIRELWDICHASLRTARDQAGSLPEGGGHCQGRRMYGPPT